MIVAAARLVAPAAALLLLSACQTAAPPPPNLAAHAPGDDSWQGAIREPDQSRLARLSDAWTQGLAEARARGFARQIDAEGPLLAPAGALPRAALPPGSYRCRVIRLGAGPRRAAFTAYPSYFCYVGVDDALLSFTKQTGSERPAGFIWADGDTRGVFLGAMMEGEQAQRAYGQDPARDLVGVAERVAPFRYRLVFPWPQGGAKLDVMELVPVVPAAD